MRVAVVAAEASGDLLGAGLMEALVARYPQIEFEGIGGTHMQAQGLRSLEPMETLSVMGLFEVLRHLPKLLRLRRQLRERWLANPPDLFIGIDAPDFNLSLETALRAVGVPTVHYVCPTVWAWRPKRVVKLKAAVDLVLSIFPFEKRFLDAHQVPNAYVGHTLAAEMPIEPDRAKARAQLGVSPDQPVLAVLPGSRMGEVSKLAKPFLRTAKACAAQLPGLQLLLPVVNTRTEQVLRAAHQACCPELPLQIEYQRSRLVMAAADVVLTASGTATLEGLLSKRPMVVGYKLNALTYWYARLFKLVNIEHMAMANLLANERLAPEFLQGECEPKQLLPAVMAMFSDPERVAAIQNRYRAIHQQMAIDSDQLGAQAVVEMLERKGRA